MEILWLGHACFRIRSRDAIIIVDPYAKNMGYQLGRQTADIVLVTHNHPGHNNVEAIAGNAKVVDGPGEYEISRVFITGIASYHDAQKGKEHGRNTLYVLETEDVTVCHLGDLGYVPSAEEIESLGNVDVLLVPVGGKTTLNATTAAEIISLLEPKIVVPMHFRTEAARPDLEPVDRFLKEMGVAKAEPQPKLAVTKSNLPDQTQVVVLDYRK